MSAGRPTHYRSEYCEKAVELMGMGVSLYGLCAEFKCTFHTLQKWQEDYPEFKEAIEFGKSLSQGWWEEYGRKGTIGEVEVNPTMWIFNMNNRFRKSDEPWFNSTKQEVTGKDNGPIEHDVNLGLSESTKRLIERIAGSGEA